eukprot:7389552-Prymnesium_polylepis.2
MPRSTSAPWACEWYGLEPYSFSIVATKARSLGRSRPRGSTRFRSSSRWRKRMLRACPWDASSSCSTS